MVKRVINQMTKRAGNYGLMNLEKQGMKVHIPLVKGEITSKNNIIIYFCIIILCIVGSFISPEEIKNNYYKIR